MPGDLIIFYSATGETERVASTIASNYNATTVRLDPERAGKTGKLTILKFFLKKLLGRKLITLPKIYFPEYEKVYIGCPVWAGKPAIPMAYFLKNTTLSEVETIPFITHESNKPFTALDELCDLILSRGGSISQKHAFKKGIPGDLIIDELEGKLFKVAKPKEIDLERFKTA